MEHSQQTVDQFIELRSQGASYSQIAKLLGITKATMIQWVREHGETINNLKAMDFADISEKHYLVKKKRVELLGETLTRIKDELGKRDLAEIPTEKLLKCQMECLSLLKQEEVRAVFTGKEEPILVSPLAQPRYAQWEA